MSDFKKLEIKRFANVRPRENSEARFWQKFFMANEKKYSSAPTSIHFSPQSLTSDFVVSAGARLIVFDGNTCAMKHQITKFTDFAYSACFRPDGRLIAAGEGTGAVKVFDSITRSMLRTFKEHTSGVRVTLWDKDKVHLISGSDDSLIKFWDLTSDSSILTLSGHTDYVRCGAPAPIGRNTWLTGSYDHSLKVWDVRQNKCAMTLDHGHPIEACLVLPKSSGLVMSAGGNQIKLWDLFSGGRLLQTFGNHQKTITTIAIDSTGRRLLSGSLDGHVKIYNMQTYQVLHGLRFKKPVTCVNLSRNNSKLVSGLSNGSLTIQKRDSRLLRANFIYAPKRTAFYADRKEEDDNDNETTNKRHRQETIGEEIPEARMSRSDKKKRIKMESQANSSKSSGVDLIIAENHHIAKTRQAHLQPYDQALRKFKYHDALDQALSMRLPVTIYTVLDELAQRGGLEIALLGRTEETLEPILAFLIRYVTLPRYSSLLLDVCDIIVDMYSSTISESQLIQELFLKLNTQMKLEISLQQDILDIQGALDSIVAASNVTYSVDELD